MKRIVFSTFVAGAALSIGCAQLQDSRMEARNKSMARAAWRNQGGAFQYAAHPVHFREGFIAGYSDIASGGDGCPPALPPKCYWSVAFQNPSGQERVKAWFDGWREGVAAAKRDGVASYGTVYVPEEYRNRGPDPNCPGGNCGNRVIVAPHPSPVPATGAAPAPPAPPANNYFPPAPPASPGSKIIEPPAPAPKVPPVAPQPLPREPKTSFTPRPPATVPGKALKETDWKPVGAFTALPVVPSAAPTVVAAKVVAAPAPAPAKPAVVEQPVAPTAPAKPMTLPAGGWQAPKLDLPAGFGPAGDVSLGEPVTFTPPQ